MRRVVIVLLLAGCATAQPAQRAATVCLPPSSPPLALWQAVQAEPAILTDAAQRVVLGVRVVYAVMGRPVVAYWAEGILLSVDPAPDQADVPLWIEQGAMTDDGVLRVRPTQACDWQRAATAEA